MENGVFSRFDIFGYIEKLQSGEIISEFRLKKSAGT